MMSLPPSLLNLLRILLTDTSAYMNIEKGTPIKVTWLDADCEAGWVQHNEQDEHNLPKEAFLDSYGIFVSLGPKFLTLSFCHNADADDWLGKHRIPRGMIHIVEVLDGTGEVYTI